MLIEPLRLDHFPQGLTQEEFDRAYRLLDCAIDSFVTEGVRGWLDLRRFDFHH
jgi:hypothetical protein